MSRSRPPARPPAPDPCWRCATSARTTRFSAPSEGGGAGHQLRGRPRRVPVRRRPQRAGKTTLLRCLAGLSPASRGEVLLEGESISGASEHVGVVFQDYSRSLFPWMSVGRNVALPLRVRGVDKARQRRDRARDAGARRPARRRGPLSVAALGRDAAAGRDRPGTRLPAGAAVHGRAVRFGRRPGPRRARGRDPGDPRPARRHRLLRHPRHRRGRLPGRPGARAVHLAGGRARDRRCRTGAAAQPARHEGQRGFIELRKQVFELVAGGR